MRGNKSREGFDGLKNNFTEMNSGRIGRLTTLGEMTEFERIPMRKQIYKQSYE
jgi:hypothetical protein